MKRRMLLLCLLSLLFCLPAMAEDSLKAYHEGNVTGFRENTITVTAPEDGTVTLRVTYGSLVYRELKAIPVTAGVNAVTWDGLGWNQERLVDGDYTLEADFTGTSGETLQYSGKITVGKCKQAMLIALPSWHTLYLKDGDKAWFVEYHMVRAGAYVVEIYSAEDMEKPLRTTSRNAQDGDVHKYYWDGTIGGKSVAPGDYVLRMYAKDNPEYAHDVAVIVAEGKRPEYPVAVTGKIMPERGMTDEEIWAIMMKPSVVTTSTQTGHQKVYDAPDKKAKSMGELHGQSQAVEVLAIDGDWARVGAWIHENGSYVEGYVPLENLMTVLPDDEYGILIDKQNQTLTLFKEGKRVGTVAISTGKVTKKRMIRETAAGAFLTVDRIAEFRDSGYSYAYPIRYDGGNLMHQMGYKVVNKHRSFDDQIPQLGEKASHGCVRLPVTPGEGDINAYWLYTHLPYHTRVIILDDQAQRIQQAADVAVEVTDQIAYWPEKEAEDPKEALPPLPTLGINETELVITVGGDAVLGTREAWQKRADAFPACVEANGMAYPFSGLQEIFANDDMTFINLECVLKANGRGEQTGRLYRFRGDPSYVRILMEGSIEQVNIANNHHVDYSMAGREETRATLEAAGIPYSGYTYTYIWEKDGHKIGFAGCRETVYKANKKIIAEETQTLRDAGCEVVIYSCHWGTEYQQNHNELQLEMARKAAEAGVDIVVGNHPHIVQGFDHIGSTAVLWSLGNLMFGGTIDLSVYDATLARLTLRFDETGYQGVGVSYIPILTSSKWLNDVNDYHPILAEGADRERILQAIQADSGVVIADTMFVKAE